MAVMVLQPQCRSWPIRNFIMSRNETPVISKDSLGCTYSRGDARIFRDLDQVRYVLLYSTGRCGGSYYKVEPKLQWLRP
jgi:hypothetical protein